eukprot:7977937-Pyramimonas_sp.AAC.1
MDNQRWSIGRNSPSGGRIDALDKIGGYRSFAGEYEIPRLCLPARIRNLQTFWCKDVDPAPGR